METENTDVVFVSKIGSILGNLDGRMEGSTAPAESSTVTEKKIAKGDPISSSEEQHLNGDHVTTDENPTSRPEVSGRNGLNEGGGGGEEDREEEEEVVDANGFRVDDRRETETQWRTEEIRELGARTTEVRTRDVRQVALEESRSRESTTRLLSPEEFDAILAASSSGGTRWVDVDGAGGEGGGGVVVLGRDVVVEELVRVETERLESSGGVLTVASFTVTEEQRKTEAIIGGQGIRVDPEMIKEDIQDPEKIKEGIQDQEKIKEDIQDQEKFQEDIKDPEKIEHNFQGQVKIEEGSIQYPEGIKEVIRELPEDVIQNGLPTPDGEERLVAPPHSDGVVQPEVDSAAATGSKGSIPLESGDEDPGSELSRKSKEVTWKPEVEPGIIAEDDENAKNRNKNAEGVQSSRSPKGGLINYIKVKARSLSRDRSNRRARGVHHEDEKDKEKEMEDGKPGIEDGKEEKKPSKRERDGEEKRAEKSEHKKFKLNLRAKKPDEEKVNDDVTRREGKSAVTSPEEADKEGNQQQRQQQQQKKNRKDIKKKGKESKVVGSYGGDPERVAEKSTPGEEDKEAGKLEEGKAAADGKPKEQRWFHFARKSDHVTKDDHVIEGRGKEAPKWSIFGRKSRKPEPEVEVEAVKLEEEEKEEDWKEKSTEENSNIELLSWKHLDDVDETKAGVEHQAPDLDDGVNQTSVKTPEIEKEIKDDVQKKDQKKFSFGLKFGKKSGKQPEEKNTGKEEIKEDEVLDTCTGMPTDEQVLENRTGIPNDEQEIMRSSEDQTAGEDATQIVVLPPEPPPSTEIKVEPEALELNLEALSPGVLAPDLPGFVLEPTAEEDIQPTFENLVCTDALDKNNTASKISLETAEQEHLRSTVEVPRVEKSTDDDEEEVPSTSAQCTASGPDPEIFHGLVSGGAVVDGLSKKDSPHGEIVEQETCAGIRQERADVSQEPRFEEEEGGTGQQVVDISSGKSADPGLDLDLGCSNLGIPPEAGEVAVVERRLETKPKTFLFGLKRGHRKEDDGEPHRQKTWSPFSKKTGKKDKDTATKEQPQMTTETHAEDSRAQTPISLNAKTSDPETPEAEVEPSKGPPDGRDEGTLKKNKGLGHKKLFGFGKKPRTPDDKMTSHDAAVTSSASPDAGTDGGGAAVEENAGCQTKNSGVEKRTAASAAGGGGEEKSRHKKFAFGLKFGRRHEKDPGASQRLGKESPCSLESGDVDKSAGLRESAKRPEQDSGTHPDAVPASEGAQSLAKEDLGKQDTVEQSQFTTEGVDSVLIPDTQGQIDQLAENTPYGQDVTELDLRLDPDHDAVQLKSAEFEVADNVESSTPICFDENLGTEEDAEKTAKHLNLQRTIDIASNPISQEIIDKDDVTGSNDVIGDEFHEHRMSAEVAVPEIDEITEISTMVECSGEVGVPEDADPELSAEEPQEIARIGPDPVDFQEPTTSKQDIAVTEVSVMEINPEVDVQSSPEVEKTKPIFGVEAENKDEVTDEKSCHSDLGEAVTDPPGKAGSPLPSGKLPAELEKMPVERLVIEVETIEGDKEHCAHVAHHHDTKWPHFGKKKHDGKREEDKDKEEGHTPAAGRTGKDSAEDKDKSSGKKRTSRGIGKGFLKIFSPKKHTKKSDERNGADSKDSSSDSIQDSVVIYSIEGEGHVVAETHIRSQKELEEEEVEKEDRQHTATPLQDAPTPPTGHATVANGNASPHEPEVDGDVTERPATTTMTTETAPDVTSPPRPSGDDGPGHFVVVAVDFGTTFSGYAFSFTSDPDSVHMMRKWEGGDPGIVNQKTPTTILLNPDGNFHSFGFTARDFYHDLETSETERWMFFEKFKMALHRDDALGEKTMIAASNGREFPAMAIFAHSLRFFRDHALKELTGQSSVTIDNDDVRWVITVPAIWKAPAKQFMRRAAYQAGIASPRHPDRLLIALEPEAASIYVRKLRMSQLIPDEGSRTPSSPSRGSRLPHHDSDDQIQPSATIDHVSDHMKAGTRYMVVDCGGGTVDITVHELETVKGCLKELHKATGGPFGSTGVDRQFETLLCEIFGTEFIETFKQKRPAGWVDLMIAFESRKRAANPRKDNPLNVSLPFSFIDFYKRQYGTHVETAVRKFGDRGVTWSVQGMLKLTPGAMIALFRPTLDSIKSAIYDVLSSPAVKGVEHLFLVGGFAESAVLQQEIRKEFSDKMRIIIPQDVSLTILKGAVCFGLDPTVVTVRRSRMTYGIGVVNRFDPSRHPDSKRVQKNGTDWCAGVFDVFVRSGQSVTLGDKVVRRYAPANHAQATSVIQVYSSESSDPRYIDDEGVTRCATLRIGHPEGDETLPQQQHPQAGDGGTEVWRSSRCVIETTMTFGDTEIGVVARDVTTGLEVGSAIDFLNN